MDCDIAWDNFLDALERDDRTAADHWLQAMARQTPNAPKPEIMKRDWAA